MPVFLYSSLAEQSTNLIMPGKRKQIRDKWKADRKTQLANNRRKKAIRITKGTDKTAS